MNEVIKLLIDLVRIPSPLGEELEIANFTAEWLEKKGFEVKFQYLEKNRPNVIALLKGKYDEIKVILCGHLDTFSINNEKPKIFIKNGYLYGRGAADMKAGIASMMYALYLVSKERPTYSAILALTVDEEGKGKGSEILAKEIKGEKAIVGEPTELTISPIQSGLLELSIKVIGKRKHITLPEKGLNAFNEALRILNYIKGIHLLKDHGELNYMTPTLEVGYVECGDNPWSIPNYCELHLVMSLLPWQDPDVVFDEISKNIVNVVDDECTITLTMVDDDEGFWLANWKDYFHNLVSVIEEELGRVKVTYMRSWCDANNLYHKGGIPTIVFGPGSLEDAHIENEKVSLKEVIKATKIYYKFLKKELMCS